MNFAEAMENKSNWKLTENGAPSRSTTGDNLIDLFAVIGAMREREESDIISMWENAYREDAELAVRMIFYAGDIRGIGLGERRTFRILIKHLANTHPSIMRKNIVNIPYYNRWDSLYELVATPCEREMWDLVRMQWLEDYGNMMHNKPISLMAKWLASVNASSKKTCMLGRKTARELRLSESMYRRALSKLRAYLKVVEKSMSAQEWANIEYSTVPSYAMKNYSQAFARHDKDRFSSYKENLEQKIADGTISQKDIKSATLYPYDLVRKYLDADISDFWSRSSYRNFYIRPYDTITEAQWKALPDYLDEEANVIVMADVSGSMHSPNFQPISASLGLALYFAERNKGIYRNKYMTFTDRPYFLTINDTTSLRDQLCQAWNAGVGYSTNLERAFMYILDTAIENNVKPEEMPKALVVVSDMEIDPFFRGYGLDFLEEMTRRFRNAGYTMPKVLFWNVEGRNSTFHAKSTNPNVVFASGYSASAFTSVIKGITKTAYEVMRDTLMDAQYDRVVL